MQVHTTSDGAQCTVHSDATPVHRVHRGTRVRGHVARVLPRMFPFDPTHKWIYGCLPEGVLAGRRGK